MNTDGGYSCACNGGYTGDGLKCNGKVFIHFFMQECVYVIYQYESLCHCVC